ncbi:MAG TPA: YbaB/EbfC family nucleoid-associated protein [Actinokineospora sp.]|nr:YbaB/EbfC family nucleoid-associated protein [Actinokineospora sp.]
MKTPEEWMRDFESTIAEAQTKAAAFQQSFEHAGATAASDDGAITITVSPTGALTDIKLTAAALGKSHTQLSSELMSVARKAQRSAAVNVADAFESVNGAGSPTYQMITEFLPEPEQEDEAIDLAPRHRFGPDDEQPAPRPARRPAPRRDDDGDFSDESIFKRK